VTKKLNFDITESLRGLAALYVVIGHSRGNLWIGGQHYQQLYPRSTWGLSDYLVLGLNMLTRLSSEFVIVFFVLSGFSIAHSLRNNTRAAPFYKRRFIRLYPPYVSALLWAMLVVWIIQLVFPHFVDGTYNTPNFDLIKNSQQLFTWKGFLENLVYLPGLRGVLAPFWSLTQELIFYLLAPFLFRNKKLYYISSIVMFSAVFIAGHYHWVTKSIITDYFFFNIFFAIGVGLYSHFDLVCEKAGIFRTAKTLWISLGIYFLMIVVSLVDYQTLNAFIAAFMSVILIIFLLTQNIQIKWLIGMGRLQRKY